MSHFHNSHCSRCNKPFHHDHGHIDDHHFDRFDNRFDRFDRFDGRDKFCDDRFQIRLGGLQSGLAFRLRQLIDCDVRIKTECGDRCEEFDAVICFVGSDFVEVNVLRDNDRDRDNDEENDRDRDNDEENDRDRDNDEENDNDRDNDNRRNKRNRRNRRRRRDEKFRIIPLENVKMVEIKEDRHDKHDKHDCC
ncbi:hypothetical protein ELQ35_10490 [Peribacillus cavernae]|uniref:Uncharacterized protein n=1 Tax=Peribacillus cavernae TaxID=1674310 RepID=A0A433HLV4_9BACI|nr:hypothetical protein [Peribacillus cavernae]MDQ0218904.1 hypothetical protein [Peribacillus cavernae]RUQ29377.1 hypothetical protein ELQ35_10490 [Peribacillus cavernae]